MFGNKLDPVISPTTHVLQTPKDTLATPKCFNCQAKFGFMKSRKVCLYCQLAYCRDCIKSCERNVYKITHNASRIQPSLAAVKACKCCTVLSSPDAKFDEVMKIDVKHLKLYLSNKNESINGFKEKTELAEQVIKVNRRSLLGPSSTTTTTTTNTNSSRNSNYATLNNNSNNSRTSTQPYNSQNFNRNDSSFQSMLNLNNSASPSTTNQMNQPTPEQQRAFEILNEMLARQFRSSSSSNNRNSDQSRSTESAGTESPVENRTTSSQPTINRARSSSGEHHGSTSIHEPTTTTTLGSATSTPNIKESMPPPPPAPVRTRASLSDLKSEQDIENLTIRQIKEILAFNFVDYKGCFERGELVQKLKILYASNVANQKLLNELNEPNNNTVHLHTTATLSSSTSKSCQNLNATDSSSGGVEKPLVEICKICMDNAIDCVLLNCGHMVSCVKCGKVLAECPICRQNIVKVVRVFKA